MAKKRRLTAKQLADARNAMAFLHADLESMSVSKWDKDRSRGLGRGIRVLESLLNEAAKEASDG